jgi:sugar lactone lactonase YvrE
MQPLFRLSLTQFILFSIALISCNKHTAAPVLAAKSMFPSSGPDSTLVTITGSEFSPTPADDLISFNGKQAAVLIATSDSLVVRTPTLAGPGDVTVTVGGKTINAGFFYYDTSWMGTTITDTITTPEFLSMDGGGNLYVSSLLNSIVYKITPAGSISPFASIPNPTGSAFDASGNLYVVSSGEYVVKVSPTGTVTPFATDYGYILGLAVGPNGNIYVTNQNSKSVDMISPQGVVSVYDSNASHCSGLAVNNGLLYVVASDQPGATGSGVGTIFSMSGPEETNPISNFTTYDGEAQLTFDKSNNLYATMINVGDSLGVVYYITPGGISSTPFMMPEIPYIVGVVADASGHLYVSGFQNTSTSFTGSIVKLSPH